MMGRWLNLALELTEAQDNSDNSDKSPPKVHVVEPIVPFVTPDLIEDRAEANIIAWINNHPPDLPLSQNHCATCGEYIEVYDTHWVYLGDGALIHYSGKYGKDCWEGWQEIRRNNAKLAFKTSKGA